MTINEKIKFLFQKAEEKKVNGELNAALNFYLEALRMVTPDDNQIECAIAITGLEGKSLVEDPEADKIDSFLRSRIVEIYRELGDYESAFHHAKIALFLDYQLCGKINNDTSASYQDLGLIEFKRRNLDNSETWLEKSNEADDCLLDIVTDKNIIQNIFFRKLIRAAHSAERGYLLDSAISSLKILPNLEKGFTDIIRFSDALNSCAQNLQNLCEHTKAKEFLHKAVDLHLEHGLENHPQMGRLYSNMAVLFHELWDFKAAEVFLTKSLVFNQTKSDYDRQKQINIFKEDRNVYKQLISRFQKETGFLFDIFISFNTHDQDIVRKLNDNLQSFNIKTWIFWDMKDWKKEKTYQEIIDLTSQTILKSKMVVMIASGASITSKYVTEEVKFCVENSIPILIWFPEGVRLYPSAASTISDLSNIHLLNYIQMIFRPGVYSLFGYGLRENDINIISMSILNWLSKLSDPQLSNKTIKHEEILTPTRLLPVFIDQHGNNLLDSIY